MLLYVNKYTLNIECAKIVCLVGFVIYILTCIIVEKNKIYI